MQPKLSLVYIQYSRAGWSGARKRAAIWLSEHRLRSVELARYLHDGLFEYELSNFKCNPGKGTKGLTNVRKNDGVRSSGQAVRGHMSNSRSRRHLLLQGHRIGRVDTRAPPLLAVELNAGGESE